MSKNLMKVEYLKVILGEKADFYFSTALEITNRIIDNDEWWPDVDRKKDDEKICINQENLRNSLVFDGLKDAFPSLSDRYICWLRDVTLELCD